MIFFYCVQQENAHFSISEALIAAIEQMKWNHVISPKERAADIEEEEDSDEEINKLKQRIRIRKQQKLKEVAWATNLAQSCRITNFLHINRFLIYDFS